MATDPVPWAVTGSQLDVFVMRELANFATRDAEGIQLPGHMKVTATGSPTGSVDVAAGGVVIKNHAGAGQSYVGRNTSLTNVSVPGTSGAGRSDLIIATIKDPDFSPWSPWPNGTDPNTVLYGPYFYLERISGVASNVTKASQVVNYSAYALARLDIPAGTTNITNAMITDLRTLWAPRISPVKAVQTAPGAWPTTADYLATTDTSFRNWPTNSLAVTVPSWATHLMGSIRLQEVKVQGASDFRGRINIGGLTGASVIFDYLNDNSGVGNMVEQKFFDIFNDIDVRSIAGQTVIVKPEAQRFDATHTGSLWMDSKQYVVYDFDFVERTV